MSGQSIFDRPGVRLKLLRGVYEAQGEEFFRKELRRRGRSEEEIDATIAEIKADREDQD